MGQTFDCHLAEVARCVGGGKGSAILMFMASVVPHLKNKAFFRRKSRAGNRIETRLRGQCTYSRQVSVEHEILLHNRKHSVATSLAESSMTNRMSKRESGCGELAGTLLTNINIAQFTLKICTPHYFSHILTIRLIRKQADELAKILGD